MLNNNYLFEELETLDKYNSLEPLPEFIQANLADFIELRDYQKKAIQYFITNYEQQHNNVQIHNLFYMATGSGKTVVMAALILYLYTKGYRNFMFFVNQSNIIEKTKDNFINKNSSKYMFTDVLEYAGTKFSINEVTNFIQNSSFSEDINIYFTSIQQLHMDLRFPKENNITFDDFEENEIVFLSDESHHVNTMTKSRLSKEEQANIESWEYSVLNAFHRNKNHVMLEFTATLDFSDERIQDKYNNKLLFDYSLKKFRQSGYTKDFKNMSTDSDYWTRALIACVMSEYRRYLLGDVGQNVKPVIMFQSYRVADSEEFYDEFFINLKKLTISELEQLYDYDIHDLNDALDYFRNKDKNGSLSLLYNSLQSSFTKDVSMIVNRKRDSNSAENQKLLNSLEDKENPIRLVFTVKMLIEGWDVLNLFDIVRLHDGRQGSGTPGKPGKYTLSEAQLIGRGARYYPFKLQSDQPRNKRKYDYDVKNPNRYLETMYFHSKNDSRYISELRQALVATGMQDEKPIERQYLLKDEFKESDFYKKGLVFRNRRVEKSRNEINSIEESLKNKKYIYEQPYRSGYVSNLFTGGTEYLPSNKPSKARDQLFFKDINYNILSGAISRYKELAFNELNNKYPNLKSTREFLTSPDYLGNNVIEIHYYDKYSAKDIFNAVNQAMDDIVNHVIKIEKEYEGTKTFEATSLSSVIKDKSIRLNSIVENDGIGTSQNTAWNKELQLDLSKKDWYVFNDNYGTSEEKRFVKYFDEYIAPRLDNKNLDYYLVRNERVSELAIYSFKDGERFEPDFIVFIINKNSNLDEIAQVYAEPKGSHLIEHDLWKEKFLLEINDEAIASNRYTFGKKYELYGLPFYNEENGVAKFNDMIDQIIKSI